MFFFYFFLSFFTIYYFKHQQQSQVDVNDSSLDIKLQSITENNNNEQILRIAFDDFKLDKASFKNVSKNSQAINQEYMESIFR